MTGRHRKPRRPVLTESRRRYAQAHERLAREATAWRRKLANARERDRQTSLVRHFFDVALPKAIIVAFSVATVLL